MKLSLLTAFYTLLGVSIVVCAVTGSRHLRFYEVECSKYVTCPSEPKEVFEDANTCVQIKDKQGLISTAVIENEDGLADRPTTCWTNGRKVTGINQGTVFYSCTGFLAVAWLVYLSLHLSLCRKKDTDEESDKSCVSCTVISTIITIVVLSALAMIIALGAYDHPYTKVLCTGYQLDSTGTIVESVAWKDDDGREGTGKVYVDGRQPAVMPAECWYSATNILFVNPNLVYIAILIVTLLLIFFLIQPGFFEKLRFCYSEPSQVAPPEQKREGGPTVAPAATEMVHLEIKS